MKCFNAIFCRIWLPYYQYAISNYYPLLGQAFAQHLNLNWKIHLGLLGCHLLYDTNSKHYLNFSLTYFVICYLRVEELLATFILGMNVALGSTLHGLVTFCRPCFSFQALNPPWLGLLGWDLPWIVIMRFDDSVFKILRLWSYGPWEGVPDALGWTRSAPLVLETETDPSVPWSCLQTRRKFRCASAWVWTFPIPISPNTSNGKGIVLKGYFLKLFLGYKSTYFISIFRS